MKKRGTTESEPETVTIEVPRDLTRPSDRLRYEAKAVFVTHPDGITVEELAKSPEFRAIAPGTLARWCTEDGWIEERRKVLSKFGEKLKSDLQKALYSRIAQVRVRQMDTVEALKSDLLSKLRGVEVRSAEGATKVVLDLMKYEAELTQQVAKELAPPSQVGTIEARNSLTEDEVLEAARTVLRARRQALAPPGMMPQALESGGGAEGEGLAGSGSIEAPSEAPPVESAG